MALHNNPGYKFESEPRITLFTVKYKIEYTFLQPSIPIQFLFTTVWLAF